MCLFQSFDLGIFLLQAWDEGKRGKPCEVENQHLTSDQDKTDMYACNYKFLWTLGQICHTAIQGGTKLHRYAMVCVGQY